MAAVLTALAPIFFLIFFGLMLRRHALIAEEFWLPCERLNYFCMFPALMFSQISRADLGDLSLRAIAGTILGAVAAGGVLLFVWRLFRPQVAAQHLRGSRRGFGRLRQARTHGDVDRHRHRHSLAQHRLDSGPDAVRRERRFGPAPHPAGW